MRSYPTPDHHSFGQCSEIRKGEWTYIGDIGKAEKRIRLSVFNTTEQISKEHMEHLFDRFYRTDRSRNSETGGYGLGLSIAAATVEAHRGKITATTEDEKSLLITVIFPIS